VSSSVLSELLVKILYWAGVDRFVSRFHNLIERVRLYRLSRRLNTRVNL